MTRKISVIFSIFYGLILTAPLSAVQAGGSVWNHNGSQMLLQSNGNERIISYLVPRPGISAKPGRVLFLGTRNGQTYAGTAYTFRRGCAPAPYQVTGVLSSEYTIVLRGASPKRSGCQITGYSNHSSNSTLVFTYIRKIEDQGGSVAPPRVPPLDPGFGGPQRAPAPLDPGFAGPQEGPVEGPVENHIRLVPGGQITFRVQDEDAPATTPIRIDVHAQCVSGRRVQLLTNYRTCAFDSLGTSADGTVLIMNMRNFGGSSCSEPSSLPIRIADLCR